MKIHEYQGKELLKRYGVPVPIGRAVMDLGDRVHRLAAERVQ